jgi:DNA-binding FadR family transcriptional regulator
MSRAQQGSRPRLSNESQGSLSDRIYEEIYRRISSREWAEGTRLPSEPELAVQFGVSRTVVREALVRLRVDGLISSRPGAGSHVIGHPSQIVLEYARPCSVADIQRCFEFRMGVEGEAAYLAAERHSLKKIAKIDEALTAMKRCIEAGGDGTEEDIAFHLAVARASENDYFVATVMSLSQAIRIGATIANSLQSFPQNRLNSAHEAHRRVYDAILAGDRDLARAAMREHIETARRRVFVGL